jgi:hypothetical protein
VRHRKHDKHPLILGTEHLGLRDVGDEQQPRTDIVDMVAQFALGEAIRGEAVDNAEGIAELVVEAWANDSGRQRVPHIAHALADVVPDVRDLVGRRLALQVDENRRQAGAGVAAQEVEVRGFLERAFDALGDLEQRVVDRGAWPRGLHDPRVDDEGQILVAAKASVRGQPRHARRDHQIDNKRTMAQRPFGEIEAH